MSESKWPSRMDVLGLMQSGWSLARSHALGSGAWLQHGPVGHGGETRAVHFNTFHSLRSRGLIKSKSGYHFPTEEFVLVEAD
jgi:hypothetical protein